MIHSNSTPSTPAHKSKTLRGFPSMNFTRFHRKVTPSFFSGSSSEASSSQTSLHVLDTSSSTNSRTTCSSSTESTNDRSPSSAADIVGRPIMDPKLLNELMEGRDPAKLLAKPTLPPLVRSKSAEPLAKSDASQDFSPLSSRRPCGREDKFYRPNEHSDTEEDPRPAPTQPGPLKSNIRFPF